LKIKKGEEFSFVKKLWWFKRGEGGGKFKQKKPGTPLAGIGFCRRNLKEREWPRPSTKRAVGGNGEEKQPSRITALGEQGGGRTSRGKRGKRPRVDRRKGRSSL